MQLQERDGQLFWTIYLCGGVLAQRHIHTLFWPNSTLRAVQKRLSILFHSQFLDRPSRFQWKTLPVPEPIYWLGWKGILWIAEQSDVIVEAPKNGGENQKRTFAKKLRKQGINWVREPRWFQLLHDMAVVDFRLSVEAAVHELPSLTIEEWIHEGEFRSNSDVVEYRVVGPDGKIREGKRGVLPDSCFVIVDRELQRRARILFELDNSNHANKKFGEHKVAPGVGYLKSPQYRARFGSNSGRWAVVTTGETRMRHLMQQTHKVAGSDARLFFFTTSDQAMSNNVLTSPIWWQVGSEQPVPLLTA
ncbi:MAG: hypothetical protein MN733_35400 [Nitrososphaera sp.]|nr:hypothetical protein [Nitrososphaera sp.]